MTEQVEQTLAKPNFSSILPGKDTYENDPPNPPTHALPEKERKQDKGSTKKQEWTQSGSDHHVRYDCSIVER
jgi:hypothetical protein